MTSFAKNSEPVRILVVDDEQDIRTVLSKGLEQEGFTVESSGDPVELVKTYKKGIYDLLLLDIRMPAMNGFELYREIRKLDPNVRVCFLTAFEMYYDEFKKVFPKISISCFIRKPVTISQLATVVREELARPASEENEQAAVRSKRTLRAY